MLQINSGKLFINKAEVENEMRGVIYTNLHLYSPSKIQTVTGSLLATHHSGFENQLIYELTEKIEKSGVLLSHTLKPYIDDFCVVMTFALNVICSPDKELTERLTSGQRGMAGVAEPSQLVKRVFNKSIPCTENDAKYLIKFTENLIALERKHFLSAMRSIRAYVTGLHRIADNLELAYTLLVASMESLATDFDGFSPTWNDYDQRKRNAIDEALSDASKKVTRNVQQTILRNEHIAVSRRFRKFVLAHITSSFYREDSQLLENPVAQADLETVLKQAYNIRSKYIHGLSGVPDNLNLNSSHKWETITDNDQKIYLTLQGLTRLSNHVITQFIERGPKTKKEKYNYESERPGIITMQWAAQYWVWNSESLKKTDGRRRLTGFLQQLSPCLMNVDGAKISDLRDMLEKAATFFANSKKPERLPFIALMLVFNNCISKDRRMKNYEETIKPYLSELDVPSVESLIISPVLGIQPSWRIKEHHEMFNSYFKQRYHKNGIKVSREFEAGMALTLAERYRKNNDNVNVRKLLKFAVENHPGHAKLLQLESTYDSKHPLNWKKIILPENTNQEDEQTKRSKK